METTSLTASASHFGGVECSRITGSFTIVLGPNGTIQVKDIIYYGTVVTSEERRCDHYVPLSRPHHGLRPIVMEGIKAEPMIYCNECVEFYPWWHYLDMGA